MCLSPPLRRDVEQTLRNADTQPASLRRVDQLGARQRLRPDAETGEERFSWRSNLLDDGADVRFGLGLVQRPGGSTRSGRASLYREAFRVLLGERRLLRELLR